MFAFIAGIVIGLIAGSVTSYFFLRANPQKAVVVAEVADKAAQVAATVAKKFEKDPAAPTPVIPPAPPVGPSAPVHLPGAKP
jgi:hypothetical protein